MRDYDVAIVGAGPAGLAVAARLAGSRLNVLLLERTAAIGASWAGHYEGLRLNTVAALSRLAGQRFPAASGTWPSKEDVARYLAGLADRSNAEIRTGVVVERLKYRAATADWIVDCGVEQVRAKKVVLATGSNHEPLFPDWVSALPSEIPVLHSSHYGSASAFKGQKVLVVGGGNSGAEIASRVADVAQSVVLSLRQAPLVLPKRLAGLGFTYYGLALRCLPAPVRTRFLMLIQRFGLGDYSGYGLPLPTYRYLMNDGKDRAPTFFPDFLPKVRSGKVRVCGKVRGAGPGGITVDAQINGSHPRTLLVDQIICATGFSPRPAISIYQEGAEVSDAVWKRAAAGALNPAPALYALGFVSPISGQLREIDRESKKIVAQLAA